MHDIAARPRRRWFQIGLAELLILTTLLAIVCWQAASWPAIVRLGPGRSAGRNGTILTYMAMEKRIYPPPPATVLKRVGIGTAVLVGGWLAAKAAIRTKAPKP